MNIELTLEQQHALDNQVGGPQRVVDPRTDTAYVLVPEGEYEATRELLEDERREQGYPCSARIARSTSCGPRGRFRPRSLAANVRGESFV